MRLVRKGTKEAGKWPNSISIMNNYDWYYQYAQTSILGVDESTLQELRVRKAEGTFGILLQKVRGVLYDLLLQAFILGFLDHPEHLALLFLEGGLVNFAGMLFLVGSGEVLPKVLVALLGEGRDDFLFQILAVDLFVPFLLVGHFEGLRVEVAVDEVGVLGQIVERKFGVLEGVEAAGDDSHLVVVHAQVLDAVGRAQDLVAVGVQLWEGILFEELGIDFELLQLFQDPLLVGLVLAHKGEVFVGGDVLAPPFLSNLKQTHRIL